MMVAEKFVPIEPDSDVDRFILQASEQPIVTTSHGMKFRIVRDTEDDVVANYDPERVRESILSLRGIFQGLDVEQFKKEILEEREQDSVGRPR
jgi:hypothetical protein